MLRYRREVRFKPRSVSLVLHGLRDADEPQGDLFGVSAEPAAGERSSAARQRDERISETIDTLREKFGPSAASFGPSVEVPGGYLGAKIAFGRIPEDADFNGSATKDHEAHFCSF